LLALLTLLYDCSEESVMKPDNSIKATNQKKVFDVSRPGRMAASATSRPVIVGHKPQVKDPMVAESEERKLMDSKSKVNLQPTGAPAVPQDEKPVETPTTPQLDTAVEHTPHKDADFPTDGLASVATSSVIDAPAPSGEAPKPAEESDEAPKVERAEPALPAADLHDDTQGNDGADGHHSPTEAEDATAEVVTQSNVTPEVDQKPVAEPKPASPADGTATTGVVFDEAPAEVASRPAVHSEPLPVLPEESAPKEIIVTHHAPRSGKGGVIAVIIALVLLAVFVFDILLDAGIIVMQSIPHTNFF
jgi:hypothetical protein